LLQQNTLTFSHRLSNYFFLIIGGSFLIALCAPISIPLPFSPIPLTLQVHMCLSLGALLGSRIAALAVLTYILQGLAGLPVFALGKSGILHLMGPNGGYLIGYVLGTYLTGYAVKRFSTITALILGNLTIYLFGALRLSGFIGFNNAIVIGILPFLLTDLMKNLLISRLLYNKNRPL
jgi:biotin transport system substrate-specific component